MTAERLEFSSAAARAAFEGWGWADFDTVWNLDAAPVEPANVRRGGWSSVARVESPTGQAYYLKRQENHDYWSFGGGLRRRPTVVREWLAGSAFRRLGIDTAEPVCLGVERGATSKGLLMTVALDGYRALTEVLDDPTVHGEVRRGLWVALAACVRRIHQQGYRHNCLYGQHVMARRVDGQWQLSLIDLEKVSRTRRGRRAVIADLSALDRHTESMSLRDRFWLWDAYFADLSLKARRPILEALAKRTSARVVDQYLRDCAAGRRGPLSEACRAPASPSPEVPGL